MFRLFPSTSCQFPSLFHGSSHNVEPNWFTNVLFPAPGGPVIPIRKEDGDPC